MSYSVVKCKRGKYNLLEKETKTLIQIEKCDKEEARSLCRKLNLGSGFCGWTPNFLAININIGLTSNKS
jgi:hypothetical protein